MESVQDRIQKLRREAGLTAPRLAELLNVSLSVAQNYMAGRTPVPVEHLKTLAVKMNLEADWLLYGKAAPPTAPLDPLVMYSSDLTHYLANKLRELERRIADLERSTEPSPQQRTTT